MGGCDWQLGNISRDVKVKRTKKKLRRAKSRAGWCIFTHEPPTKSKLAGLCGRAAGGASPDLGTLRSPDTPVPNGSMVRALATQQPPFWSSKHSTRFPAARGRVLSFATGPVEVGCLPTFLLFISPGGPKQFRESRFATLSPTLLPRLGFTTSN